MGLDGVERGWGYRWCREVIEVLIVYVREAVRRVESAAPVQNSVSQVPNLRE